jgi:hypothetical protein
MLCVNCPQVREAGLNANGTAVERADPPAGGEEPACGVARYPAQSTG